MLSYLSSLFAHLVQPGPVSQRRGQTHISTDIVGIGYWAWGGVDNLEWEQDANLIAMKNSDITYKSGDFCRNPHCPYRSQ
jgi:hypothetical protein